jgi:hypothetical protein
MRMPQQQAHMLSQAEVWQQHDNKRLVSFVCAVQLHHKRCLPPDGIPASTR